MFCFSYNMYVNFQVSQELISDHELLTFGQVLTTSYILIVSLHIKLITLVHLKNDVRTECTWWMLAHCFRVHCTVPFTLVYMYVSHSNLILNSLSWHLLLQGTEQYTMFNPNQCRTHVRTHVSVHGGSNSII